MASLKDIRVGDEVEIRVPVIGWWGSEPLVEVPSIRGPTRAPVTRHVVHAHTGALQVKSDRLRRLAIAAYHVAETPLEAKMAGILCDLYAPEMSE